MSVEYKEHEIRALAAIPEGLGDHSTQFTRNLALDAVRIIDRWKMAAMESDQKAEEWKLKAKEIRDQVIMSQHISAEHFSDMPMTWEQAMSRYAQIARRVPHPSDLRAVVDMAELYLKLSDYPFMDIPREELVTRLMRVKDTLVEK